VLLGRSHHFVIGKHSGLSSITASLADLRLPASAAELRTILDRVREHAVTHKGPIAAETLAAIWRDVCARPLGSHS
jgi:homocitrate synthase NifV